MNPEDPTPKPEQQPDAEPAAAPEEVAPAAPSRVVGVNLADGKVVEFDAGGLEIALGDTVVVDNEKDLNLGQVVFITQGREGKSYRPVQRRVGPEDFLLIRRNKKREEEAFELCQKRIAERDLPMKLIRVAYLHGGNKAIFYFSAEGRVDFRALVRDLAQQLHVRIEMRQIGVRDESKMLGGVGICGQPLCCSRFLRKFVPVSIKMAKNQNLALNPQKLSGLCGRLMCCLVYEDDSYLKMKKDLPKIGASIQTAKGEGKIIDINVLERRLRVQLESEVISGTPEELQEETRREEEARAARAQEFEELARVAERQEDQPQRRDSRRRRKHRKKPASGEPAAGPPAEASADAGSKSQRKKRRRRRRRKKKKPQGGSAGSGEGNP